MPLFKRAKPTPGRRPAQSGQPIQPIRIRRANQPARPVADVDLGPTATPLPDSPSDQGARPATAQLVGRLPSADQALDALIDLRMAQPPDARRPVCRRDPADFLWIVAEISPEAGAGILWTAGGDVFVAGQRAVLPYVRPGSPIPRVTPPTTAELAAWPRVTMLELLAETAARPEVAAMSGLIGVLTSARLAHHVLRTLLAAGAEVSRLPVERQPLFEAGQPQPAVLLDVQAARAVPVTVVRELAALPYTTVGRYADQGSTLLVDAGLRLPADVTELTSDLAAGQLAVIGRAGAGAWMVRPAIPGMRPTPVTRAFTVSDRQAPSAQEPSEEAAEVAETDPARRSAARAEPIASSEPPAPVTLVPSRLSVGAVDAVLVPERDLIRFKQFALGQPLAEDGLLIPGDGCFLVTESAGLRGTLPLGLPLRRVGPGGLYLAHGYSLSPSLPPTARASLFNVRAGQFVAVCPDRTYRFAGENARWVWSLWLPPTRPQFATGMSARGRAILERTDTLQAGAPPPTAATGADQAGRARLRREAILLEQEGRTQRAAELLEEAGQYARAASLYERLARAGDPASRGETR